jgi:hypothetical protein
MCYYTLINYRWGYYDSGIFWDNSPPAPSPARPRISASLLREGFEDYEYLFKANGNKAPRVNAKETSDDTAMRFWERGEGRVVEESKERQLTN